jgi:hypothetical protein
VLSWSGARLGGLLYASSQRTNHAYIFNEKLALVQYHAETAVSPARPWCLRLATMPAWGFTWSLFLLEANSELIFQAVGEIHNVDLLVRMPTA